MHLMNCYDLVIRWLRFRKYYHLHELDENYCNWRSYHIKLLLPMLHPRIGWVGVGGWENDEQSTTTVQPAQTVTIMYGVDLSLIDKSGIQKCSIFFCLTRPFRPQLSRLCHISHAH